MYRHQSILFMGLLAILSMTANIARGQDAATDPFQQRLEYKQAFEAAVKSANTGKAIQAAEEFAAIERVMVESIKEYLPDDKATLTNAQVSLLEVLLYLANAYESRGEYDQAVSLWEEMVPLWETVQSVHPQFKKVNIHRRLNAAKRVRDR